MLMPTSVYEEYTASYWYVTDNCRDQLWQAGGWRRSGSRFLSSLFGLAQQHGGFCGYWKAKTLETNTHPKYHKETIHFDKLNTKHFFSETFKSLDMIVMNFDELIW